MIGDGSAVASDGRAGYGRPKDVERDPRVVGETPARLVLPRVRRVFANARRRASGVDHGLRPAHLRAHLDELVFRSDRRRDPPAAFDRLLGPSLALGPATHQTLAGRS